MVVETMKNVILPNGFYYYYLGLAYIAFCFGTIVMAVTPIFLFGYIQGVRHPDGGNWPLWAIPFLAAYCAANFLTRKGGK